MSEADLLATFVKNSSIAILAVMSGAQCLYRMQGSDAAGGTRGRLPRLGSAPVI
jgi:hypothetical protein